jgi:nitroimidazol reductase NimA-like FMN-containing flavoprotein (pyridoxamine 5'-phosphate oxidase superfamily)
VTEVGGIVVARSAFESSIVYRSAMLFGTFSLHRRIPQRRRRS